jgi:hypothetical protein
MPALCPTFFEPEVLIRAGFRILELFDVDCMEAFQTFCYLKTRRITFWKASETVTLNCRGVDENFAPILGRYKIRSTSASSKCDEKSLLHKKKDCKPTM